MNMSDITNERYIMDQLAFEFFDDEKTLETASVAWTGTEDTLLKEVVRLREENEQLRSLLSALTVMR